MNKEALREQSFVVAGATGALGHVICRTLVRHGANVIAIARNQENLQDLKRDIGSVHIKVVDVTDPDACSNLSRTITTLNGLVYVVGDCPVGGFEEAIRVPLSAPEARERLRKEWEIQVAGLQNILAHLLPKITENGRVVTINSDINRIPHIFHPSYMHDGHYASAKIAQEQLIKRMRQNDPIVLEKKISMSLIFPMAVDTPFHTATDKLPPATVSTQQVADVVIKAIHSPKTRDYRVTPAVYRMIWGVLLAKRK